jgi:hypothetical protein
MRKDALAWANGSPTKLVSRESLNHRGLIEMVTGLDVYKNTSEAYKRAYQALGVDIMNRVPLENAPEPTPEGETRPHPEKPYIYVGMGGVYDTVYRHTYPCTTPEEVWDLDVEALRYDDLITPVPHPCGADDIKAREEAVGDAMLYHALYYTTLFMWGVEVLGWEIFLMAAALEPDRFHEHFLLPCVAKSEAIVTEIAQFSDSPFVFVHDDLASATGPMFRPSWYDKYIFPHYPEIWSEAKRLGKKIMLIADGNMTAFLPRLLEVGVDGLVFETPSTSLDAVIEYFGEAGLFFIGGIGTAELTLSSPAEVRQMVMDLHQRVKDYPGFCLRCSGGLQGNIPLENLEAYFDARAEIGATPEDWRTCCHVPETG